MAGGLGRFDPLAELSALQKQLFSEGLFGRAGRMPTTDIYTEEDSKLTVEAHLPGFAQDDIDVDLDAGALVIRAQRHEKEEDKGKKYVVRESSSTYYRRVELPDQADADAATASFDDGVLRVTVPYKELPSARKIAITKGDSSDQSGAGAGGGTGDTTTGSTAM